MRRSSTAPWVIGTAFLALVLMAAAWFLGISPLMDSAAQKNQEADAAASQAMMLQTQLIDLKKQYEDIDSLRATLDGLRVQMPTTLAESELTHQIDALALGANVTVTELSPTTAVEMIPVAADTSATADAGASTDSASATTDSAAATTDSAAPVTPAAPAFSGLWSVPTTITVVGGLPETLRFIDQLQTGNPRLLLVTGLTATALSESGGEAGMPAVKVGDLETRIQVNAYVMTPTTPTTPDTTDGEEALPLPSGQPNPFAPGG